MDLISHEKFYRGKNILITGGAGFIGSNLVKIMINFGANVTSLDNYLSGSVSNHHDGCNYVRGSVEEIFDIFDPEYFNLIFHFGEYSRVEASIKSPDVALQNSYASIVKILEFWRKSNAKLIYSGSSTKFAHEGSGRHLAPYTFAKAANSDLVVNYSKWYGLPFCLVYFYNVFGRNEICTGEYATLIGKYKELVRSGHVRLPVSLPGTQVRNFTHIDDVINGIVICGSTGIGDMYGIGSNDAYSVLDVCRMFGCEPDYIEGNSSNRMGGPVMSEKIKQLGWRETRSLPSEIKDFLNTLHGS